ncbi:hypothetical protein C1646_749817 [Rhizophagus diaphanus]|nr:hypothetical protein C1646_749817 [Rhizophagus diaphanus] [Rhizophagus sp. MUCL 43196]
MAPLTPITPLTPLTPNVPVHYNPSKTSISSPSYNIPSSPLHEMEILQPNDNRSHRHFKIIEFSILTTNTLNSTISSSPSPTRCILCNPTWV